MTRERVGIDLHRGRALLVRMSPDGKVLSTRPIEDDPVALSLTMARAAPNPDLEFDATYGWCWAGDVLSTQDHAPRWPRSSAPVPDLTSASGNHSARHALVLADVPCSEALRDVIRSRAKLVALRSLTEAEIRYEQVNGPRFRALEELITLYDSEIQALDANLGRQLWGHPGYLAVRQLRHVGPALAAFFVAEIDDVHRFAGPEKLCSWAGLTHGSCESGGRARFADLSRPSPTLVRWAAIAATSRRGSSVGRVAAARKLLRNIYYSLRDGEVRGLPSQGA